MDYRLHGLPPALWRRVRAKAGHRLRDVLLGLLRAYANGVIDPLSDTTPAQQFGAAGGRARAAKMSPDERMTAAQQAAHARWHPTD